MVKENIYGYRAILILLLLVSPAAHADLQVFACEPEWASLTRSLAGEHARVFSATSNQQDPHHIQARPSLIAKVSRADLLVCAGAELEIGWLPLLLRKSANPEIQPGKPGYFMATDKVQLLGKPTSLDRSQGDIHSKGNPHIQLDPGRIALVAKALKNTLITLDPDNQLDYEKNFSQFKTDWQDAMNRWRTKLKSIQGKRIVVQHASWIYH